MSGPVFMFCAAGLVFGGVECVGSRFHVLRGQTHFRRYRGRRVPFSCFVLPDSFSAVPSASGPVLITCAPGIIFDGAEGVVSLFNVLRAHTRFRRYLDVGSRFHVLRARTRLRRCRVRRVSFSYFTRPESFSTVPRASGPVFMFCVPVLIFGRAECVGSHFNVLRAHNNFRRYRGRRVLFSCFAPKLVFDGTECVGSRFHVLRFRTSFRRQRGRRVPFSCFARSNSFSTVPRGVGSRFHVLRS
jgi:hypothetical protein